jgi:hypothetical protein
MSTTYFAYLNNITLPFAMWALTLPRLADALVGTFMGHNTLSAGGPNEKMLSGFLGRFLMELFLPRGSQVGGAHESGAGLRLCATVVSSGGAKVSRTDITLKPRATGQDKSLTVGHHHSRKLPNETVPIQREFFESKRMRAD